MVLLTFPPSVNAVACTTQIYMQDGVVYECEAWWVWNPVEGWVMIDADWNPIIA